MFTSNYSVVADIYKFQKIPTMVLLNIFQYLNANELFMIDYNKNTKDLCVCINKDYPIITKSLIYKQLHPPVYLIRNFNIFTYDSVEKNTYIDMIIYFPKIGIYSQKFRYNDHNNMIDYKDSFKSDFKIKKKKHTSTSTLPMLKKRKGRNPIIKNI